MKGYDQTTGRVALERYSGDDWDRLIDRLAKKNAPRRKKSERTDPESGNNANTRAYHISVTTPDRVRSSSESVPQNTMPKLNWSRVQSENELVRNHEPQAPGRYRIPFGLHKGQPLAAVPSDYLRWLRQRESVHSYLLELVSDELERRARIASATAKAPNSS